MYVFYVQKWSDYCDSCVQGVVYVSFGSLLKGMSFPDKFLTSMVRAFEMLPYCVLWKYEGNDIQSKRIKVSKWMSQQQILSIVDSSLSDVNAHFGCVLNVLTSSQFKHFKLNFDRREIFIIYFEQYTILSSAPIEQSFVLVESQ